MKNIKNIKKLSSYFYSLASNEKDFYIDFLDSIEDTFIKINHINEKNIMHKFTLDVCKDDLKTVINSLRSKVIKKENYDIKPIEFVKDYKKMSDLINNLYNESDQISFDDSFFNNFKLKTNYMINDYIELYKKINP